MLGGEAEQGLPGTVDWGCWLHKGLVDGGWEEGGLQKGSDGPRMCALSAPGVKAAVSRSGSKQRRTHREQKLDSLCLRTDLCLEPGGQTGEDNVASRATVIWGCLQRSSLRRESNTSNLGRKATICSETRTVAAEIQVSGKTEKRKTMAFAVPANDKCSGSPPLPPPCNILRARSLTPPGPFPVVSPFYQDSRLRTEWTAEFSCWPLFPTPALGSNLLGVQQTPVTGVMMVGLVAGTSFY